MRIAVQASDLDNARIDGTRVYLKEMLKRFGTLAPQDTFSLYHRGEFNALLAPPQRENYCVKRCPFPLAWMQTRFVGELFCERPDKLFLPVQAAPFLVPSATEVTVTIHDLAFKRYPETFPKRDLWKLNFFLNVAVRRAQKLIAVSQSTKDDLLEFFPHLPEEHIKVIHHGFDGEFFSARLSAPEIEKKLSRYNLHPQTYILYVGALQPRKNLARFIEAFNIAKKSVPEMKLVLAGEPAWLVEDILDAQKKSAYKDDIVLTGRVDFEELRVLYQGARCFTFPSLYEGFGLPVLEALASSVPVLLADNSSLREVGGSAALYVNSLSTYDMAEKLERLWNDQKLRADLVTKGQEQLKKFSWDKCAKETLDYIQV